MQLSFWTDAESSLFRDVVLDSLAGLTPKVPVRRVMVETGITVFPEKDEVVVAMGMPAVDALKASGQVAKNKSLTALRETAVAYKLTEPSYLTDGTSSPGSPNYGHWMFSFSPNSIFVEADRRSMIAWDVRLAHRFCTTHSLEPKLGTYEWTDTFEYIIQYVEEKFEETGKMVPVALDLEAMGLIPWYEDKEIVTVQMTVAPGYSDVVHMLDPIWKQQPAKLQKLLTQIRWIMTSPKVALYGANLKFDILWMWVKWGIRPTNFKFDTLLAGSLLDENRSNSLKEHAKQHTEMGGYELSLEKWLKENKLDKGDMHKVPKDKLLQYAGPDTDATLRVALHQRKELKVERGLQRFYLKLLHPAARAFEAIEHRGLVADLHEFGKLEKELQTEIAQLEKALIGMMPGRLRAKFAGTGDMLRAAVLQEFFFTKAGLNLKPLLYTPTGKIKTDKAHFMMFREHPEAGPFIELYSKLTSAKKMLGTYVHGFLNHLRPDGRFHPTYMLFNGSAFEGKNDDGGTDTGRLSAVDPAVQTIPKHTIWAKKIRKCYPAPPGYRFFQADFQQGELRLAACAAEDETMIDAYLSGKDLHCVTGAQLAGLEFEEFMALKPPEAATLTKAQLQAGELFAKFRQRAKPANFGLLYGLQAEGFRAYAYLTTDGKMDLTLEEAAEVRDAFFALYSRLLPWHEQCISIALNQGYIENPLGRIAHLPLIHSNIWKVRSKAERKSVNSPIQSTLSDLCAWAISFLEERYGKEGLWIAGMTHDSIYGYYPENEPELWLGRIKEVMETLPYEEVFDWHPVLTFPVDIEEGPNMAELTKYGLKK